MFLAVESAHSRLYLLLPLASSLIYVASAMSLKRASQAGAGVWRTAFVMNLAAALLFSPLPLLPIFMRDPTGPTPIWQPMLIALAFVAGQVCTMLALNKGDVSVATPVVGTKVVFVAFFATLIIGDALSIWTWISAGMSALGIALLNRSQGGKRTNIGFTIAASLGAAASYAIFDVMVRQWAPVWGPGRLLPLMFWLSALFSVGLAPLFEGPLLKMPRTAATPMVTGSLLIGLQALLLVTTIATFPYVTEINIVYNSRGLWSVMVVWLVGHWWGNSEMSAGGATLRWRIAGAVLLLGAIVLSVAGRDVWQWATA